MKNTEFFIKKKHLYRFCIRWHMHTQTIKERIKDHTQHVHMLWKLKKKKKKKRKDKHAWLKKKYGKKS